MNGAARPSLLVTRRLPAPVEARLREGYKVTFNPDDRPLSAEALARYIRAKMEFSRRQPKASRIFAMEVISGGDCLSQYFNQNYLDWFRGRAAVFEGWIAAGKMDPVDPNHLIFLLWSSTQHYADFASQICRVTGRSRLVKADYEEAGEQLISIILKGCGLTPPAKGA